MNQLKKVFFALAAVVALGASNALAQCTAATVVSTSPLVRLEATVELIGNVTVTCNAAAATTQASISITLAPSSTVFVATSTSPNNTSTFPQPTLTPTGSAITNLQTIGAGTNTLTFTFNPDGVAAASYSITGLRANINASGLPSGSVLSANVVTGGSISAPANTLIVGIVNAGLSTSGTGPTGFTIGTAGTAVPMSIASCGPAQTTPSGSTAATNPDKTTGAVSSLVVTLKEGFINAWQDPETDTVTAGQGTRFRIQLTGIPSGISVWAPDQIVNASAAPVGTASDAATQITRVDSTVAADGSGGALVTVTANQFDKLTVSGGALTIIYEVSGTNAAASENVTIFIAFTGAAPLGTGAITGSVGFAPIGPATTNASRPQFAAASTKTVANVVICASYLLFPWVAYTGDGAYDTGFAISNTTADPSVIGTVNQTGDVTLYFWRSDGTNNPSPVTVKTGLKAGETATYTLSQLGAAFTGYAIAVCNFQLGHGFAFINSPQPGTGGAFAQGYLALSVNNPRLGAPVAAAESAGH